VIDYDQKDDMHIKYIEQIFGLKGGSYPCYTVRYSEAFVNFSKQGLAYCLILKLQIQVELASGELINLMPGNSIIRTLYWHHWALLKRVFKQLLSAIISRAQYALNN
jgi:LysR family transcriptional regulator (chromosome initiation inhibitor)